MMNSTSCITTRAIRLATGIILDLNVVGMQMTLILLWGLFTRRVGHPRKRVPLALAHFLLFFSLCLQGSQVTRVSGLPYLRARVTLADGLFFSLVNTPGRTNPPTRVSFLTVSRLVECNRASSCPGL